MSDSDLVTLMTMSFSPTELVFLDVETGEIVVDKRIDREQTSWLNFTVKATDSGRPPRASNADVYVQVSLAQSAELPTGSSRVRSAVGEERFSLSLLALAKWKVNFSSCDRVIV